MQLKSFRITNFRSINDSDDVEVSRITAILGRNESGKSNLLRALGSLNPVEGFARLDPVKDFPRHRPLSDCKADTQVVSTTWVLDPPEQAELTRLFERASSVTEVVICRRYDEVRPVSLLNLSTANFNEADVRAKLRKTGPAALASAEKSEASVKLALEQAVETFERAVDIVPDRNAWAQHAVPAFKALRTALAAADTDLSEKQEQLLSELEDLADSIASEKSRLQACESAILGWMPKFIFFDEYPELDGHQNIAQYLARRSGGVTTPADRTFEKLCKVSGLNPTELHELFQSDQQEKRNLLANRAGSVVTTEIKRLWKDRPLKIRFNLDAHHLDTLVSDPHTVYDVEVNLNERSRGFLWFFSFYITFSADTAGGAAENAVLLLDEPGLYLHARSQTDLLRHFESDYSNQILFTTHSPFMVPTNHLEWVRTVSISEARGTTVSNDPAGDTRTLFPLQAALGYDLAQTLFVGPNNLVVEGVTDYWILATVSGHLAGSPLGGALASELTLTPAGGAQKVSYMVALLSSEQLNVLVLFDHEREAKRTKEDLVKNKLIREQNVLFISSAFEGEPPGEADIEDLLPPTTYEALVRESYAHELSGVTLSLNPAIPRIVKRFEDAFEKAGLTFVKTRPARLFLNKMATDPDSMLDPAAIRRFQRLFGAVNGALAAHLTRGTPAFF